MKSLKEIWNSELPSNSFEKLDTLIIEECDKFENVFPCDMEVMFLSLCNLRVTNCKSMEAVFVLGFYPAAYILRCPALNDMSIEHCDRLEPFKREITVFSEE
ncbi:hypothetical protein A2U01_0014915, partial [Trifolium medium]|nr:hypothetical protein [Trifolium medium]